jgi:GH24 family phage-related lysozyme (muramidase)
MMNSGGRFTPYVLLAVLVLGTGLGIGLGLSEASSSSNESAIGFRSASQAPMIVVPTTFPTTLPGGQKLPPGAVVTSVVHFLGQDVAAGADISAGHVPVLAICAVNGCNPIVWTSPNGRQWTAAWGNTGVTGSIPGEELVSGAGTLLLFLNDEGTRLWSTTDAITWHQVVLPETVTALDVTRVVFGHGRFVAILNNKYAGGPNTAYGENDAVWTSTNGETWTAASVAGPPAAFESLTVTPKGFRITGALRQSGSLPQESARPSTAWISSGGIRWAMTAMR